jgi:hypothetical protein
MFVRMTATCRYAQMTAHVVSRPYVTPFALCVFVTICAGTGRLRRSCVPATTARSIPPCGCVVSTPVLCFCFFFCSRVSVWRPPVSRVAAQAIDVWSVGCVLAELCVSSAAPAVIICNTLLRYQLFKSDNRSFRPFFYGTIKLGPGEREGEPLPAALCSKQDCG